MIDDALHLSGILIAELRSEDPVADLSQHRRLPGIPDLLILSFYFIRVLVGLLNHDGVIAQHLGGHRLSPRDTNGV